MSSHFLLTQYYRMIYDDATIFYDALIYYWKYKKTGKSRAEFFQIVLNVMDVESQNYEEVDSIRLGGLSEEDSQVTQPVDDKKLSYIAKDYLINIILKFILDDLSQYPFWAAKVFVSFNAFYQTHNLQTNSSLVNYNTYGELINKNFSYLYNSLSNSSNIYHLLQGSVPFLIASFIYNFPQLISSTKKFILLLISKIPRPPSLPNDLNLIDDHKKSLSGSKSSNGITKKISSMSNLSNFIYQSTNENESKDHNSNINITFKDYQNSNKKVLHAMSSNISSSSLSSKADLQQNSTSYIKGFLINSMSSIISHPFLVIATHKILNPTFSTASWIYTYLSLLSTKGISVFYKGLKSRAFLNYFSFPFNTVLKIVGLHDTIIYRRIILDENLLLESAASTAALTPPTVSDAIVNSHSRNLVLSTILSPTGLLNYGVLTIANIIPGFLSFVAMRISTNILFGRSIHRRQQQIRRKEIIHAYLIKEEKKKTSTIKKKISFANLDSMPLE